MHMPYFSQQSLKKKRIEKKKKKIHTLYALQPHTEKNEE